MLRNFPHQINQLDKMHAALACTAAVIEDGQNPLDDGILGYSCARKGVYTFRDLPNPIPQELEKRISVEQRKTSSNQGPRTFARDLRRTLILMGLLDNQGGMIQISPIGQRLLQFPLNSKEPEYIQLWKEAVLRIILPPTPQHRENLQPAPLMLRIAEAYPGIEKRRLSLAFEAQSNSDDEFRRLKTLISSKDFERVRRRIGATTPQVNNSVKIIPALLEQTGLLEIRDGICRISNEGRQLRQGKQETIVSPQPQRVPPHRKKRASRLPEPNVKEPNDIPISSPTRRRSPSPEVLDAALELLGERTREHQVILRQLVSVLQNVSGKRATRDKYDLYVESTLRDEVLVFEVKTGLDYLLQGRLALGQLCQYEFFDIRPLLNTNTSLLRIVVFGGEPGQDVRDFLNANGILVVVHTSGAFVVPPELKDYFKTA